jgi:hypothetical protein
MLHWEPLSMDAVTLARAAQKRRASLALPSGAAQPRSLTMLAAHAAQPATLAPATSGAAVPPHPLLVFGSGSGGCPMMAPQRSPTSGGPQARVNAVSHAAINLPGTPHSTAISARSDGADDGDSDDGGGSARAALVAAAPAAAFPPQQRATRGPQVAVVVPPAATRIASPLAPRPTLATVEPAISAVQSPLRAVPEHTPIASSEHEPLQRGAGSRNVNTRASDDGRGDGRASSVMSKRSVGGRLLTRLRRVVFDAHQPLLPGLQYLRVVGLALTAVAVALAIGVSVFNVQQFEQYEQDVSHSVLSGKLVLRMMGVLEEARYMTLAQRVWMNPSIFAHTRLSMKEHTDEFLVLQEQLYSYAEARGHTELYNTVDVPLSYFPNGDGIATSTVNMSLLEATMTWAAGSQGFYTTEFADIAAMLPPYQLLANNGQMGGLLHSAVNDSMLAWFNLAQSASRDVVASSRSIYITMSVLLAVTVLLVFLPILVSVERAKDRVTKRFVQMPMPVLMRLRAAADHRLRVLQHDADADDEDDSGSSDGDDEEERKEAFAGDEEAGGAAERADGSDGEASPSVGTGATPLLARPAAGGNRDSRGLVSSNNTESWPVAASHDTVEPSAGVSSVTAAAAPTAGVSAAAAAGRGRGRARFTDSASGAAGAQGAEPNKTAAAAAVPPAAAWGAVPPAAAWGAVRTSVKAGRYHRSHDRATGGDGSVGAARAYRKGVGSLLWLLAKFVGPLLVLYAFFSVLYFTTVATLARTEALATMSTQSQMYAVYSHEVFLALLRSVGRPGAAGSVNVVADGKMVAQTTEAFKYLHGLLVFGGPVDAMFAAASRGITHNPHLDDAANELLEEAMFGDACAFLVASPEAKGVTYAECAAFGDGIMTRGLHGAVTEYLRRTNALVTRRLAATTTNSIAGTGFIVVRNVSSPYSIATEFKSADSLFVEDAALRFQSPALAAVADVFAQTTHQAVTAYSTFQLAFVPVFLVAFVAFMALGYFPALHATNQDIQKQRAMLLLLPPEVVQESAAVRELVEILLSDASDGGRGAQVAPAAMRGRRSNDAGAATPTAGAYEVSTSVGGGREARAAGADDGAVLIGGRAEADAGSAGASPADA